MSMSNSKDTVQGSKRRKSDSFAIHTFQDISEPDQKDDEQRSFSRGSL